jgi:hypothetical protein
VVVVPVLAPHVNRITYCSFLVVARAITAVPRKYRGCVDVDSSGSFVLLRYVHLRAWNFAIFGGFAAGPLFHENRAFAERGLGKFALVFFLAMLFTCSKLMASVLGLPTVLTGNGVRSSCQSPTSATFFQFTLLIAMRGCCIAMPSAAAF